MLGELRVSSGVKYHWLVRVRDALIGDGCAEADVSRRDCGGSEDVREE